MHELAVQASGLKRREGRVKESGRDWGDGRLKGKDTGGGWEQKGQRARPRFLAGGQARTHNRTLLADHTPDSAFLPFPSLSAPNKLIHFHKPSVCLQ